MSKRRIHAPHYLRFDNSCTRTIHLCSLPEHSSFTFIFVLTGPAFCKVRNLEFLRSAKLYFPLRHARYRLQRLYPNKSLDSWCLRWEWKTKTFTWYVLKGSDWCVFGLDWEKIFKQPLRNWSLCLVQLHIDWPLPSNSFLWVLDIFLSQ